MTAVHYRADRPAKSAAPQSEIIASFPDVRSAEGAVENLGDLPVEARVVPIGAPGVGPWSPGDATATDTTSQTITGGLFGAIWGMLMGVLILNFLAVNPSMVTTMGLVVFGTAGGMAVGGLIGGVLAYGPAEGRDWRDLQATAEGEAFLIVTAERTEDADEAYARLRSQHATDVYRG